MIPQGEGLGVVIHPQPSRPLPAPDSWILGVFHFCTWVRVRAWVETDGRGGPWTCQEASLLHTQISHHLLDTQAGTATQAASLGPLSV